MLLLLAGARLFVWREGDAGERSHGLAQTQDQRIPATRTLTPDSTQGPALPPDPFKAALEAPGPNHATNPESPAAAEDPFRQVLEDSRQKRPATLSSPFGVAK